MATSACTVFPPRMPLPPREEWQSSAGEQDDVEATEPFPEARYDLIPREILAAEPPARDERLAIIEWHVAHRLSKTAHVDPARVAGVILRAADWAGVDPILVLAMIEVESGFDIEARSNRGARGLMQVRPPTLWSQAARSGLDGKDPHAPELNVPAGVLYYRRLLDTFRNEYLALVAYNAGPNRVSALLRSGGIPERFREYPRRVFAAEERLRHLLGLRTPEAGRDVRRAERTTVIASD